MGRLCGVLCRLCRRLGRRGFLFGAFGLSHKPVSMLPLGAGDGAGAGGDLVSFRGIALSCAPGCDAGLLSSAIGRLKNERRSHTPYLEGTDPDRVGGSKALDRPPGPPAERHYSLDRRRLTPALTTVWPYPIGGHPSDRGYRDLPRPFTTGSVSREKG
jgi:hypothetical protein